MVIWNKKVLLNINYCVNNFNHYLVDTSVFDRVNGTPSEEEERGFKNVHMILEALLKAIPLYDKFIHHKHL